MLTQTQISEFWSAGYLVLRRTFSADEMAVIKADSGELLSSLGYAEPE